jgi:rhodanese-related sulfurtransferase
MLKFEEITKQTERAKEYFESKVAFTLGPVELKKTIEEEADRIQIIDLRQLEEYNRAHIPTAVSVPGNKLELHIEKLSKNKINILYCYDQQCHLAAKSALMLAEKGYPVMELEGGFNAWKNKDFDFVSST